MLQLSGLSRVGVEPLERRLLLAGTRFAVIGDFSAGAALQGVANEIDSWNPDFIATVGDNNYPDSNGVADIDVNIGQ